MPKWANKAARDVFWTLLVIAIVNRDISDFLPLADHSNLRFQLIGECVEIIVLASLFLLLGGFLKQGDDSERLPMTLHTRIVLAAFIAIFLLTGFWRDFFPNGTFSLSAGAVDFVYAPLAGLGSMAISYVLGPRREKPNQEEGGSVV
jgi:hypothetical protein